MKRELDFESASLVYEEWPGQFERFSHFEFTCGIPQPMFVISTLKENGLPNACLHSWSSFSGDGGGFFAIMSGLGKNTHTYANIVRDKVFCINFLSPEHIAKCVDSIKYNSMSHDEFEASGFTAEPARTIDCVRIAESFLCLECRAEYDVDLSKKGISATIVGRVEHIAMEDGYMEGIDKKYSREGFMSLIHSPVDYAFGKNTDTCVGYTDVISRID